MSRTSAKNKAKGYKIFVPFLVKFSIISAFGTIALSFLDLRILTANIAAIVAGMTNTSAFEDVIFVGKNPLVVTNFCIGLESGILLAAIILSIKKPRLGRKIYTIAWTSALLIVANIFRIAAIVLVATINLAIVEIAHIISWFFITALIFTLWYFTARKDLKESRLEELI